MDAKALCGQSWQGLERQALGCQGKEWFDLVWQGKGCKQPQASRAVLGDVFSIEVGQGASRPAQARRDSQRSGEARCAMARHGLTTAPSPFEREGCGMR